MAWLSLALVALIVSLGVTLLFSGNQRQWARLRVLALVSLEIGGILFATLVLITLAYLAKAPSMASSSVAAIKLPTLFHAAGNTSLLVVTATLWGTLTGLGAAYFFTASRHHSAWIGPLAAVFWVLPTFLSVRSEDRRVGEQSEQQGLRLSSRPQGRTPVIPASPVHLRSRRGPLDAGHRAAVRTVLLSAPGGA